MPQLDEIPRDHQALSIGVPRRDLLKAAPKIRERIAVLSRFRSSGIKV